MEKGFRVPLKFGGYKYFYGENAEVEAKEYETEMIRKEADDKERQKKELEERKKKVEKAEAERKAKEEAKEYRYNQVLDKLESLNKVVEAYEKETNEKLEYITVNGKLEVRPYGLIGTFTSIPVIGLSKLDTHDNWWNQLYKELRGY